MVAPIQPTKFDNNERRKVDTFKSPSKDTFIPPSLKKTVKYNGVFGQSSYFAPPPMLLTQKAPSSTAEKPASSVANVQVAKATPQNKGHVLTKKGITSKGSTTFFTTELNDKQYEIAIEFVKQIVKYKLNKKENNYVNILLKMVGSIKEENNKIRRMPSIIKAITDLGSDSPFFIIFVRVIDTLVPLTSTNNSDANGSQKDLKEKSGAAATSHLTAASPTAPTSLKIVPPKDNIGTGTRYKIYYNFANRLLMRPTLFAGQKEFSDCLDLASSNLTSQNVDTWKIEECFQKKYGADSYQYKALTVELISFLNFGMKVSVSQNYAESQTFINLAASPFETGTRSDILYRNFVALHIAKTRNNFDFDSDRLYFEFSKRIQGVISLCKKLDIEILMNVFAAEYVPGTIAHETLTEVLADPYVKDRLREATKD